MSTRGFTLIELMVSVAIFTIVMTVALGSLLSITAAERKAETLKSVINNLHFALDSMSRSIRTGYNYNCGSVSGGDCAGASGGTLLYFDVTDSLGTRTIAYCRGDEVTCNANGTSILQSTDGGANFAPVTAPEIVIEDFTFYVIGSTRGDDVQPRVTITLQGKVDINTASALRSAFTIQTTVTQRLYDL